jgi:hypothetical protein
MVTCTVRAAAAVATPQGFTATYQADRYRIYVKWNAVEGAEKYNIYFVNNSTTRPTSPLWTGTGTGLNINNTSGGTYTIWIQAVKGSQTSAVSQAVQVKVPAGVPTTQSVTFVNETGETLSTLNVSPKSSDNWGDNWLSGNLAPGASVLINFPSDSYDVRGVGNNKYIFSFTFDAEGDALTIKIEKSDLYTDSSSSSGSGSSGSGSSDPIDQLRDILGGR